MQVFVDGLFGGNRFQGKVPDYSLEESAFLEGIVAGLALLLGFVASVLIFIVGGLLPPFFLLFLVLLAFGFVKKEE